jgi:hypothetical protein
MTVRPARPYSFAVESQIVNSPSMRRGPLLLTVTFVAISLTDRSRPGNIINSMLCGRWLLAIAHVLPLTAQYDPSQPLDPDVIRLARIKVVMAENLLRLPNYTCLQTIERSRRSGPKRRFELTDTIRLEVALVEGKELFSWPGAGRFEDRRIGDLVGGGTIGNGNFALHARSVFLSSVARYEYQGEVEKDGRRVLRYNYRVPRNLSGYHVRIGEVEEVVAYFGSFDVDARTLDLAVLEVNADEIPPRLPVQAARDVMRYRRQNIGGSEFLLPYSSELTMVSTNGDESRNRVEFSACRQYSGESVLSFEEPPPADNVPPPAPPVLVELPGELDFELRLETPIRYNGSAVGDEVLARVAGDVKRKGQLLIPKGAVARGRLKRLEKAPLRQQIGMGAIVEFNELEYPGHHAELRAVLTDILPWPPGLRAGFKREQDSSDNIFYVNRLDLPKGFRMMWRTKSTPR